MSKRSAAAAGQPGREGGRMYGVVNPQGIVHTCTREYLIARLKERGWRQATAQELDALAHVPGGVQDPAHPLAPRWEPEIVEDPEVDDGEEE